MARDMGDAAGARREYPVTVADDRQGARQGPVPMRRLIASAGAAGLREVERAPRPGDPAIVSS